MNIELKNENSFKFFRKVKTKTADSDKSQLLQIVTRASYLYANMLFKRVTV